MVIKNIKTTAWAITCEPEVVDFGLVAKYLSELSQPPWRTTYRFLRHVTSNKYTILHVFKIRLFCTDRSQNWHTDWLDLCYCGGKDGWHKAKFNDQVYIEPILGHLLYW